MWNATKNAGKGRFWVSGFQYPRTDRVECYSAPPGDRDTGQGNFQYPRTDRVECYNTAAMPDVAGTAAFSILGRIVWNATGVGVGVLVGLGAFSILGRIVWNATLCSWVQILR